MHILTESDHHSGFACIAVCQGIVLHVLLVKRPTLSEVPSWIRTEVHSAEEVMYH